MFDVSNKQYILSLSTGRKAYIYYNQGNGILMRWNSEGREWQKPVPAAKNGLDGFCACLDKENGIHVLYQDYGGNIIYMKYSEGAWNRRLLLRSRNQDTGNKQLYLACCENRIYAFFVIEYAGKKYLGFQDIKSSDSSAAPKTIDQVGSFPAYWVLLDNAGDMSVFYSALIDGKKTSGFRTYETGASKWGNFQPFPSPLSDLKAVCVAAGLSGALHLCFQKNEDKKYSLVYSKIIPGVDSRDGMTLAESEETFYNTEISVDQGTLRVFWANKAGIFCRTSHDDGNSWDAEQKLEDFDETDTSCFCYLRSTGGIAHEVHSTVAPGSFRDIPQLAFLEIPTVNASAEAGEAENLRKAIAETLKLLSGNINDLRDAIRELDKRLDGLDARERQLELDISKCGIKDKFLENDLLKIKSELESLKTRINEHDAVKAKSGVETGVFSGNMPLMPGAGFNNVTAEYLKGLKK